MEEQNEVQEIMIPMSEVIAMISMDVSVVVPDRQYVNMTPLQCYEAGVIDTGTAVRKAIREAIAAKWGAKPEAEQ
jgi:hypothetical protein